MLRILVYLLKYGLTQSATTVQNTLIQRTPITHLHKRTLK